ncbi:MAG TPA: RHS repeat-associated core domain-containing protein [Bryobacteraceae bacterium]|nr:RHS repeat-associated core domain-containing protein [Bryobacteraceae bacterium]
MRQKFTGKERDSETGLDYFGLRYFSSAQGRWTSPDQPFTDQHPEDPQSWNMYGYVRNNPLKNTDPDGRACSSLIGNTGSGFCQRAVEYSSARFDADPRVSSQTRFFAAAAAVSEAVANVDGPGFISNRFVSPGTATFLEKNIGQDLEQLNSRTVEDVRNGSLAGPNLDARLVHTEQTEVQKQLDSLNKSDPAAYAKTISEINGVLNPTGVGAKTASSLFPTDRAFGGVLDSVRRTLGRNIDFSKQSDREAIGNALINHIRQQGGCNVSNNVTVCK